VIRSAAAVLLLLCVSCSRAGPAHEQSQAAEVIRIWQGQPPGTESWSGAEQEAEAALPNIGKVHVITNVIIPTLTVFRPKAGQANGTAMIVVPGGAFRALPWDLDGIETSRWLTAHGITAFVLKYRVRPPPSDAPTDRTFDGFARRTEPARVIAVADAEQAVRLIRAHAKHYGISPHKIGMIGFSAGAMATMDVALDPDEWTRPDFAASLYGALLTQKAPAKDSPPLFIAAAEDDPELSPEKSVQIFNTWTKAGLPAELHVYEHGGHGFAFRTHHTSSDQWPAAFQAWLSARGLLKP
jgi:acetyl esterase/lipase